MQGNNDKAESGAIHRAFKFWLKLKPSSWVKQWIMQGVPLYWKDVKQPAPAMHAKNHASAMLHEQFVDDSINALHAAGAIEMRSTKPKCVSAMSVVPKKNNKLRLIVDLRHVNKYLWVPKFKFESLEQVAILGTPNARLCAADLTNGYWQVRMDEQAWDYLGIEWHGKYYVCKCLPFGLASAPWVFHEVMQLFCSHLRNRGFRIVNYLDDFLFIFGTDHAQAILDMQTNNHAGIQ